MNAAGTGSEGTAMTTSAAAAHDPIVLWPQGAPGALGTDPLDVPTLTPYLPARPTPKGTVIIVCPGGGYRNLAMDHEGRQIAEFLNGHGVTAFVLAYRLGPRYVHPAMLQDAQRAIRYVRAHADDYGLRRDRTRDSWASRPADTSRRRPPRTSTAAARMPPSSIDRQSSRPDFLVLCYPVVTFVEPWTHQGSRDPSAGHRAAPERLALLSNEQQVTKDTPPTFLFHTDGDKGVPAENSVMFYLALRRAGVPAELHVYEQGAHGLGLAANTPGTASWPARLAEWLAVRGLVE